LVNKERISDICDELNLQSVVFYRWQEEFFEGGHVVFERSKKELPQRKITELQEKLSYKDGVIAELAASYVAEKKEMGRPERKVGMFGGS